MAVVSFVLSGIPQNLEFGALQRHELMEREEEEVEEVLAHALSLTLVDLNCLRRCVDCC